MTGLGLIMELAGSLFATLTATIGFTQLLAISEMRRFGGDGGPTTWLLLLTAAGVVRSLFLRAAGVALLYGAEPSRALRRYFLVAGVHTLLWVAFAAVELRAPTAGWLPSLLLFGGWPVALALMLSIPELRLVGGPVPRSEDRGFAGLTVLMIVLGLVGALFAATTLLSFLHVHGGGGVYIVLIAILLLLVARSLVQTHAGTMMLADLTVERAETATGRYGNLGVLSGIAVGAAGLIMAMTGPGGFLAAMPMIGGSTLLLLTWPLIVRRFAIARRLEAYLDDGEPGLADPSDQGRTTLGWLLLGVGVFAAATALSAALFDATAADDGLGMLVGVLSGGGPDRAPWLAVAVAGLQVWAGIELILVTPRHRTVATVYGIAGVAVALYIGVPIFRTFDRMRMAMPGSRGQIVFAALAIGVIVPLVTIALVQRRLAPRLGGGVGVGRIFE